jgi:hypothetical protein
MKSRQPRPITPLPARRPRSKPLPRVRPDELWLYRERTLALLYRYFRLSLEYGRLPSLLGREFFRTRVTSYHMITFEDGVIFVHDMEGCLERLRPRSRRIIARMVFQEYTQEEMAHMLRCTRQTVATRLLEALDELSAVLLGCGLLFPLVRISRRAARPPAETQPEAETQPDSLVICGSVEGEVLSRIAGVSGRGASRQDPERARSPSRRILTAAAPVPVLGPISPPQPLASAAA